MFRFFKSLDLFRPIGVDYMLAVLMLLMLAFGSQAQDVIVYRVPAPRWQRVAVVSPAYVAPAYPQYQMVCQGGVCQYVPVASPSQAAPTTVTAVPSVTAFDSVGYTSYRTGPFGRVLIPQPIRFYAVGP